ncbi:TVP38/TMEM64 family protein [Maridesulfovibrio salexigens]|uniref:TVP38/TMEM64 family membrane protein n=1 Tax=Maridesulfovibrio salexigens (strain ATCC 14822 / DSM 2638 / NCIMB 8403 / VKM B-1763) TaxID=526222 RepID=C6BVC6_MARSD|nr:TVP38/TMEM64 family protein [Maridesulfovibrio salexigens]ACS80101.1 SNARE associated Golgi protein [Maridesulfovibrio salexigens DSM 2638]
MKNKILIITFIAVVVALFFAFDLDRFLTLEYIKNSRQEFQVFYDQNPFLTVFSFFLVYVLVVGVNLPGATVLGLAGGALFGFTVGVLTISFASTIGATLACFFSRHLFRDYVQRKFGDRLEKVNRGIEEEGAFYLFTMRLIPAIPFVVINLLMGLTTIRLRTFYWVSQLGMLPGTMVYVNAGKELGKIDSLSGIVQPGLLISFALLGIFPLVVKKIVGLVKVRRNV